MSPTSKREGRKAHRHLTEMGFFSVLSMSSAGDRLLEVDGINFQGFTYQQAVECLSKTEEVMDNIDFA